MCNFSKVKVWWLACRSFSFPASVLPVIFGTVLAVWSGASLNLLFFLLAVCGMLLLHGGANILNDVCDYQSGLDKEVFPVSGAVIRRWLTPQEALCGGCSLLCAGSLIGLYLAWHVGWIVLFIGFFGVLVGILYSAGKFALKYNALGDFAVFLNFGLLGALGSWVLQTGSFSWLPVIWVIPIALLVIGILHGNNWRDRVTDQSLGCQTVAGLLGDEGSFAYYSFLVLSPYLLVIIFITCGLLNLGEPMPLSCGILSLLSLPKACSVLKIARFRQHERFKSSFAGLDGETAKLSFIFGILYILGFIVGL